MPVCMSRKHVTFYFFIKKIVTKIPFLTRLFLFWSQYKPKDQVVLWMNTVGPYHNRQETYSFFTLPFCKGKVAYIFLTQLKLNVTCLLKYFFPPPLNSGHEGVKMSTSFGSIFTVSFQRVHLVGGNPTLAAHSHAWCESCRGASTFNKTSSCSLPLPSAVLH